MKTQGQRAASLVALGLLIASVSGCGAEAHGASAAQMAVSSSSAVSSTGTAQGLPSASPVNETSSDLMSTYTPETFPFIGSKGETVVGASSFDRLIAIPYDAAALQPQGGDPVVRQFFRNRELCARASFAKRYGPVGPDTSISSRFYLDAFKTLADPTLTDLGDDGAFVQSFLSVAEGPMHDETVTDAVFTNEVMGATDYQNGGRPTLGFWTRVTETTTDANGTQRSGIRYFYGSLSVENGNWLVTAWNEQDAGSASTALYGTLPSDSTAPATP